MRVLVTGGLGFIGSATVRLLLTETDAEVINLDKVSYASTFESVAEVSGGSNYSFVRCDLADADAVLTEVTAAEPDVVIHLAAESHVDHSIDRPDSFVHSNVVGTFNLLEAVRRSDGLDRFVHVSTDEVFGSLPLDGGFFDEDSAYNPRSPYSATKAASDHLVRAWGATYDLPISVTNCSNNYGPYQFPEKLIPLMIIRGLLCAPLPVYGTGENVRDWLFVEDHARALLRVATEGRNQRTYAIGGNSECSNLDLVRMICTMIDQLAAEGEAPRLDEATGESRADLIEFVTDRPGHDLRYAVQPARMADELDWTPTIDLEDGLARTVRWYVDNRAWWEPLHLDRAATARVGTSSTP